MTKTWQEQMNAFKNVKVQYHKEATQVFQVGLTLYPTRKDDTRTAPRDAEKKAHFLL